MSDRVELYLSGRKRRVNFLRFKLERAGEGGLQMTLFPVIQWRVNMVLRRVG